MTVTPALRTAGIFSLLSPLAILAGVPIAASLRGVGGPGPIDFGNAELLARLALALPRAVWVDAFALLGPVLALPMGVGWYLLAREQKSLALFGTLLLRVARFPKWLAMLGLIASVLPCVALLASLLGPQVAWLGVGLPIGVLVFVVVFTPITGFVMLRWKA